MSRKTRREGLQAKLEEILVSRNVYFQPPASFVMKYPCFVYSYENDSRTYADDNLYLVSDQYSVTYITKDPMPDVLDALDALPYSKLDRQYTADNLHHFSYTVYVNERITNG